MNTHSIDLIRYCARSRGNSTIYLGTAGSHGNEQLQVTLGKGWEGLTVQVVFHPCKVAVQLPANGVLDVPWEATARPLTALQGRIVFQGFDQDRLVNSTDLAYTVASHSPALGRDEQPYTPGIVEGVLNQMAADKDAILQAAQQTGQAKEAAAASAAAAASSAANAQQSAGAANTSAGQAAASASQAAGSAAAANETLTQVQTAGQEAQQKVKDAETEALGNISAAAPALPAVSAAAAWQSVTVKPDGTGYNLAAMAPIEATIRPTVTGNPAVCEDSAAWAFQGLAIYGKSTQDGTPSPENPVPIVSAGDGGSIDLTVCGANIFNFNSIGTMTNLNGEFVQDGGYMSCILNTQSIDSIYISGDFTLLNSNSVRVGLFNKYPEIGEIGIRITIRNSESIDVRDYNYVALSFIGSSSPTEWSQIESNFIISIGDNPIPYEPYKSQSFTIPTPTGLPGIPVTSGGNFTDADGQQWICDEVNFVNLKKVSMVYKLSIKSSMPITLNSSVENFVQFTLDIGSLGIAPNMEKALLCNRFKPGSQVNEHTKEASMWIYTSTTTPTKAISLAIIVPKSIASTADEFKTWISENETYVLLPLATPIENDVSAEELAAYKALTTYDGTTVVSTAEPVAGIEASYVMDGNKYRESVDKRLAALEAAQTGI